MSLPLGFSPFDDYDSPYASTNAAIRRQSRPMGQGTPGQTTPTSSFQQQQSRRPSQGSFTPGQVVDAPPRRSSPPPPIPAAEDFGSSKRFSSARKPSMDAAGVRHIAKPMPLGAPWAEDGSTSTPPRSPVAMPTRSPPASPRSNPGSPSSYSNAGTSSPSLPTRRSPPPPPAARASAGSTSGAAKPAQYPPTQSQRKSVPVPMPVSSSLPEPAEPPAASKVALATPADVESNEATTQAPAMRQVGSVHSEEDDEADHMVSPVTSDDEIEHNAGDFRTPTEEEAPAPMDSEGRTSQPSYGRDAGGAAGLGAAAALASGSSFNNVSPRRARDAPNAAPHTSYDMGGAGPFNEKNTSEDRALLTGASGAGAGAAAANRSYKPLNEGSRGGWSDSHGAGAGAGGAAGGSALGRSWRAHKKRWIIGLILLIVVILAAAIGGGVAGSGGSSSASNRSSSGSNSGSGSGSSSGSNSNGSGNGGTKTSGVGPLDSRLTKSFYGMNYAPQDSNLTAGCGANITGVIHDVTILTQLTSKVRLLGSACNETAMVLDAIDRLGVDMQVWPAVALTDDMTPTSVAFTTQLDNISYAFDTFGTANIGGVSVGDEYLTSSGSSSQLEAFITAVRRLVTANTDWGTVLVGSAETSSVWTAALARQVDFVFANDESYDEGDVGADAAAYAYQSYQDFVVETIASASNDPPSYISAIGWPSAAQSGTSTTLSSLTNVQAMLDSYVCEANTNGTGYFWFELYDAAPADITPTGTPNTAVPGYWGLFDSDKNLKDLTLPDCPLS
ncbi:glycoside hydrolase [Microstroma glucosiphilum]|uniref:glucan endo-1,3-beta-D-glucosidase n=1 Tax=Pseudomicrostroma glucosiphilum TaxID=1684307 RepID=A0A316UFY3_9BASI|nr:glycoside hydrolase [Pseudomicrostroma glucosiphilum]PWN24140.1 glycoside hydrolase [Pseudomicrostroma glucosiphilum]